MVVHESTLVPMPDKIDYEVGSMIACGTSTAWLALEKLQISSRDVLAIFGQGPVGVAASMVPATPTFLPFSDRVPSVRLGPC